jgi:cytochrome c oxidase subunit II
VNEKIVAALLAAYCCASALSAQSSTPILSGGVQFGGTSNGGSTLLQPVISPVLAGPRPPRPPKTITITAARFAFDPNEITVNRGEEVTLVIHSKDVTHGLVIEDLSVRTEVKKGQSASVTFTPAKVGTFVGKCAHFCGSGHGSMTLIVHVVASGAP